MKALPLLLLFAAPYAFGDDAVSQTALLQMQQNVRSINDTLQSQAVSSDPNLTDDQRQALVNEQIRRSQLTGQHSPPGYNDGAPTESEKDMANSNRLSRFQSQQAPAQSQSDQTFNASVAASRKKVYLYFPEAKDPKSPIQAKAGNIWKFLQDKNSPLVYDTDAPFIVYSIAAAELGIAPAR